MASTNQTANYGLPIYSANDRASWIDTNQAFENIDAAVKEASDNASSAASDVSEALSAANEAKATATGASSLATQANTLASTADAKADANASNISALQSTVTQQGTDLDAVEEQAELNRVAIGGVSARMTTAENQITELTSDVSWKEFGNGASTVTVPSGAKEIHIDVTMNGQNNILSIDYINDSFAWGKKAQTGFASIDAQGVVIYPVHVDFNVSADGSTITFGGAFIGNTKMGATYKYYYK